VIPRAIEESNPSVRTSQVEKQEIDTTPLDFFVHSIELFNILDLALKDVYHPSHTDRRSEPNVAQWWPRKQLGQIMSLNEALDDLSAKLPGYLRQDCSEQESWHTLDNSIKWQGYVFRCRYHRVNPFSLK
jgi:hypothetical protein